MGTTEKVKVVSVIDVLNNINRYCTKKTLKTSLKIVIGIALTSLKIVHFGNIIQSRFNLMMTI